MSTMASQPTALKPKGRWYRLTPDRLVVLLLAVEGLLWLAQRLGWLLWLSQRSGGFRFDADKGWAVLAALAIVALFLLAMLFWFVLALLLRLADAIERRTWQPLPRLSSRRRVAAGRLLLERRGPKPFHCRSRPATGIGAADRPENTESQRCRDSHLRGRTSVGRDLQRETGEHSR
jgi:hypothetical protein